MTIDSTLSFFPWKLNIMDSTDADAGSEVHQSHKSDENIKSIRKIVEGRGIELPSYLDLRRRQNIDFVKSCTDKASIWIDRWKSLQPGSVEYNNVFKLIKEELHKALELIPDDLESLLLYSQILLDHDDHAASSRSRAMSFSSPQPKNTNKINKMVKKVINSIDPGNVRAKVMLRRLEQQQQQQQHNLPYYQQSSPFSMTTSAASTAAYTAAGASGVPLLVQSQPKTQGRSSSLQLTARESSAFQNALMERKLLLDDNDRTMMDDDNNDMLEEIDDDSRDRRSGEQKKRERKHREQKRQKKYKKDKSSTKKRSKKEKKRKKKKHKTNRDENDETNETDKEQIKKRKKKHSRRRRRYDSDDSNSHKNDDDDDTVSSETTDSHDDNSSS